MLIVIEKITDPEAQKQTKDIGEMRKTRHWKLFRRRMLLEATMGCRYWRWHHWGCRLSNLSCRYHAVAPAIPCTLHLGPDIHRLLPASPISRLAFYIPIKLNELVQVIQKILSPGCPVVAWWKIISPPIDFFITFMFLMITISMIIMATMMKCFHIYRIYRLQRLGQWPLFRIIFNCFQCWALPATSWKNTHRWRYIIFNPMISYLIIKTNIIFFFTGLSILHTLIFRIKCSDWFSHIFWQKWFYENLDRSSSYKDTYIVMFLCYDYFLIFSFWKRARPLLKGIL